MTRLATPLLLAALLAPGPGLAQAPPEFAQTHLYVSGTNGYHTFRIPAIVRANDGTVLAFCEGRVTSGRDDGDIDLVLRRSADGGRTWTPLQVVQQEGVETIGNPAPVVDRQNGRIWVLFCRNNDRVFTTHSNDAGATWSSRVEITSAVKQPSWGWYATGPVHGIQLLRGAHAGRLVVPCDFRAGGAFGSHLVYSDNGGASWQLGGIVNGQPGVGPNECTVVELTDGRLYLNMRNQQTTTRRRLIAYSADGGLSFGPSSFDQALIDPRVQASAVRLEATDRGDGRDWILFSNPATTSSRTRMTVRSSLDETATWPARRLIHAGPSAYSDMVVTGEGQVGLLYENGDSATYERITFARFDREWLGLDTPDGLLAKEGFDYPVDPGTGTGDLDGKDGGSGFAEPWKAGPGLELRGYWKLDGDLLDSSPAANHGSSGGGTFVGGGPAALGSPTCLQLNGNGERAELSAHVGDYQALHLGTIAGWFRTAGNGAHVILAASDRGDASREIRLFVESGVLRFDVRGDVESGEQLAGASAVNDDVWHHAAATVDIHGTARLYLDGVEIDRQAEPFFAAVADLDRMAIGRNVDSGGGQWYFPGRLADIAIWSQDLSPQQVTALAQGVVRPSVLHSGDSTGATLRAPSLGDPALPSGAFGSRNLSPAGNRISEGGSAPARRALTWPISLSIERSLYLSCLLRRTGPLEQFALQLCDDSEPIAQIGWTGAGVFGVGGANMLSSVVSMAANTAWFCVLRVEGHAVSPDSAWLKVYPPSATVHASDGQLLGFGAGPDQWTAAASFPSDAMLEAVAFQGAGPSAGVFEVDELRIGTSWQSVTVPTADIAAVGDGCPGSTGWAPRLGSTGTSSLGSTGFAFVVTRGTPSELALFAIGSPATPPQTLPNGCPAHLDPAASPLTLGITFLDPHGTGNLGFAVPATPALGGMLFVAQALVVDAAANGGFVVTQGLELAW